MRYWTIAFFILSLTGGLWAQEADRTATVYQTVNVRSGPGTQFEVIGQLNDGDIVPVLGRESEDSRWLYVDLPDGDQQGWVAVFTVTLNGSPETLDIVTDDDENAPVVSSVEGVEVVAFGRVNVRSGPAIDQEVVGQLEAGDTAQVVARNNYNNDWLYIEAAGAVGWLAYFTVNVRGNPDELPVLVPDVITGELVPPSAVIHANYNVRLHIRPAVGSRVTGTVPFGAEVALLAATPSGRWLYVMFEQAEGWGWAGLFDTTDEQMVMIPRRTGDTLTPPVPTAASN